MSTLFMTALSERRAVIDRPYSSAHSVGAVYDRARCLGICREAKVFKQRSQAKSVVVWMSRQIALAGRQPLENRQVLTCRLVGGINCQCTPQMLHRFGSASRLR